MANSLRAWARRVRLSCGYFWIVTVFPRVQIVLRDGFQYPAGRDHYRWPAAPPESGFSLASKKLGSGPDRRQQFLFCHLANASSHVIASPILGNILFEATNRVG